MGSSRSSCLKFRILSSPSYSQNERFEFFFIKGTWFPTHFILAITDGFHTWTCNASEREVREKADQWDQSISDYIDLSERHLGFQQPGSVYKFIDAEGGSHRVLSWTFEKEGIKLEWRWKCQPAKDCKLITAEILDFLMAENIKLQEEVLRKNESLEEMKVEAEKCLAQSERFVKEKIEFESSIYAKFVGVLNSKKAKLRELRKELSEHKGIGKLHREEEEEEEECSDGSFDQ